MAEENKTVDNRNRQSTTDGFVRQPRGDRRPRRDDRNAPREEKMFEENVIAIDRVAHVVKGGRRFRFKALVVVGDRKNKVGVGVAKGADVQMAVAKATDVAKKSMITVPIVNSTIPHDIEVKIDGARVLLKRAAPGTGIIAGGVVRSVVGVIGITDLLSKSLGSANKVNIAYATVEALRQLVPKEQWVTSTGSKKKEGAKEKQYIEYSIWRNATYDIRHTICSERTTMKYNELNVSSSKTRKRVGRGIASGHGKTAGRGTKGQGSRSGNKFNSTFMGGQGKLVQRIPKKRGFLSLRAKTQNVYTAQLNDVKGTTIDATKLFEAGLINTPYHSVKLIARGDYTGKANVKLQAASKGAIAMLEKAGGSFEAIPVLELPSTNEDRAKKRADKAAKKSDK